MGHVRPVASWSTPTGSTNHAGADFGWSVAIDGNTIVVGAYDDEASATAGLEWPHGDGGATYGQVAAAIPDGPSCGGASDGQWGQNFGHAVAIDGGTVVVAATTTTTATTRCGLCVFRESAGTYAQVAKLTAADGATWTSSAGLWRSAVLVVGASAATLVARPTSSARLMAASRPIRWQNLRRRCHGE